MATRQSIAEQVLRIINGGEVNEDSRIELRDIMPLVDARKRRYDKGSNNGLYVYKGNCYLKK
jgi:hypothetical protein